MGYSPWGNKESDTTEHTCNTPKHPSKVLSQMRPSRFCLTLWLCARCQVGLLVLLAPFYLNSGESRVWVCRGPQTGPELHISAPFGLSMAVLLPAP